jgi:hypothetical protein
LHCAFHNLHLIGSLSSTALQAASASIQVRSARPNDIPFMRKINIKTLPENYTPEWWDHHLASWPQMTLVAEHSEPDQKSVIVGYALGQIQVVLSTNTYILLYRTVCLNVTVRATANAFHSNCDHNYTSRASMLKWHMQYSIICLLAPASTSCALQCSSVSDSHMYTNSIITGPCCTA